eukprot:TRINITY_DN75181_c0_g1_i1.p1 TRINITY_DN75181_c0_g1~~TRINITY_DN75181_c0_g1_i1.p1  ORF type:complete len:323 (-),score=96.54 TRINITY_DN75181_c0_g1_i1:69-995(-)
MALQVQNLTLNTGREIPAIGFGTGTSFFGRGDDVAALVGHAFQAGLTSFDTAVIYGTEDGLGSGLSGLSCPRSSLYVTTKTPDWAWTKEEIVEEVEKSLKRLQVTYLDLVLLHTPAPRKGAAFLKKALTDEQIDRLPDPMDAKAMEAKRLSAWQGLEECVEKGLVRDIGVSNFTVHHLHQLITKPEIKIRPSVNQVELNPYQTDPETYIFCKKEGILLQAFGPLGNGREMLTDPVLVEISKKKKKTTAQVSLRWAWQLGVATVTKTEKIPRMKENIDIFDFELDPEEMEQISGLNKNIRIFGDNSRFP